MNPSPRAAPSIQIVVALCCAAIAFAAVFLAFAGGRDYLGSLDYRVYLTSGKLLLNGAGAQFYDLPTQFAVQRGLWPEMTSQKQLLPFLAPPFVAVLFAPLAALPIFWGYVVWTIFNAALLWFIARGLLEILDLSGGKRLVALGLMLTFAPVLFTVMQGQVSLLVVLAWLQSYRAAKANRDFGAGIWFSLALIRPQLAILPLLIFALKGRWKIGGGFALGALILGAISLAIVGFDGLMRYKMLLGEVTSWQNRYGVQPQQMQTWRGFLHALLATDESAPVRWPWILGGLMAVGTVVWCWRGAWNIESSRFERQWAVLPVAALFCCPYLYSHDLSLLLLSGALLFGAARRENSRLMIWPVVGYLAVLSWAILGSLNAGLPSLAVGFEAVSLGVLGWWDGWISGRNWAGTKAA